MKKFLVVLGLIALIGFAAAADAKQEAPAEQEAPKEDAAADAKQTPPTEGEVKKLEDEKTAGEEVAEQEEEEEGHPHGRCEICVYVLTRKIRDEGTMCSKLTGLYHKTCKAVLEAMVRWDQNVVHWLYQHGCEHVKPDHQGQLVRPCPPHAICSWITHDGEAFCEEDKFYKQ